MPPKSRTPAEVEEHYDDCGTDITSIQLAPSDTEDESKAFSHSFGWQEPSVIHMQNTFDHENDCFDSSFHKSFFFGSDCNLFDSRVKHEIHTEDANKLLAFLNEHQQCKSVDLAEVCGGKAGVSRIAFRMNMKSGKNFDLVTHYDLTKAESRKAVTAYVAKFRPLVLVMAPPCTAFGSWSRLNSWKHPISFAAQFSIGMTIAKFIVELAFNAEQVGITSLKIRWARNYGTWNVS